MTARAVLTTAGDHHDEKQQNHDGEDDPEHLHPAWHPGIGDGPAMCVSSRALIHDGNRLSRQSVDVKAICFHFVITYINV